MAFEKKSLVQLFDFVDRKIFEKIVWSIFSQPQGGRGEFEFGFSRCHRLEFLNKLLRHHTNLAEAGAPFLPD
jgi:hypothetical protein